MEIGQFKFDEAVNDLVGRIVTRKFRFPYLIMRKMTNRQSDNAPVFEIIDTNEFGEELQLGLVFERRTRANNDIFLSGYLDDPSFPEEINVALFGNEQEGFVVQWRRERERDGQGGGSANGQRPGTGYGQRTGGGGQRQGRGGGFAGGSTAGPGGEYVGGRSLDDDVPF